ncbi:MAG: GNAT family N-acetyltransferase [Sulfurifustis sp.]
MRNRGIALALVTRAVEDARAQGLKIVPVCSYARAEITAHAEWHDVLAS